MTKHDCAVPPGSHPKTWTCPTCGQRWYWHPNAGKGADLWHGNDNVRMANGQKPKTTFWDWLCE